MSRVTAKLLFFIIIFLISSQSVLAIDNPSTGSAVVSATVISTSFAAPILIAPINNSATNNPREPLSWKRPSPLPTTSLHHYDVYLDEQMFASSISDSITSQTYYFYTVRRTDNTFYLDFTTDLAQGYHTWRVVAYDTAGISSGTGTWTYYIDSTNPFITVQKADHQTLNWTTLDYTTIPNVNQRDLTITTSNPLLIGKVEPYANMQIILMCPTNIPANSAGRPRCQNQIYQGNYPSGIWQHRFYDLIRGLVYTVYLSTTDAGGSSVIFPEFYLAYGIITPSPTLEPTKPTASPSGEISPTPPVVTPTPEIEIPFTPLPPTAPTPPVFLTATPVSTQLKIDYLKLISLLLLVFGLPLHLFMIVYGTKTRFTLIPKLFFVIFFPFLGKKDYQTVPFATIEMFDPDKLTSSWQTKISDIKGYYSLTSPLINKIFIKISCMGRYWKNVILSGILIPQICLFPILETPQTPPNSLRHRFMIFRSLPLVVACLTSAIALIFQPNYFFLIYLYLSLHLVFTEYLYPRLQRYA